MESPTSQISRHRDKTSLLSKPDGEGCGSHPKDLSILLQAGEAVLIKLLPPSSMPHFSALLFDDKSLQIRFPLPAVSLLESTSRSAGRKLGGWWREKGPACLLFLSASLWQTPSSFPHTPPTSQPPTPKKAVCALQRWQHNPAAALPPGPSSEPLLYQHSSPHRGLASNPFGAAPTWQVLAPPAFALFL